MPDGASSSSATPSMTCNMGSAGLRTQRIPQIALGLGAGAGVAGAAAIAATAVNQLVNHWGELTSLAQAAWSGSSVKQLEDLRKGAEEASKAFDELSKKPTTAQAAQNAGIEAVPRPSRGRSRGCWRACCTA